MKTVYILCEGYAERQFVAELLYDPAFNKGIYLNMPIVTTKKSNRKFGGGVSKYSKIREDLIKLCNHSNAIITSMFDLYKLPKDTPGYTKSKESHYEWTNTIEQSVNADIATRNIHFNLVMHEFEMLLYADPSAFHDYSKSAMKAMENGLKVSGGNPELVNNGFDTSPSHRILKAYPNYSKSATGIIIAKKIGLEKMRRKCSHFNEWLSFIGI